MTQTGPKKIEASTQSYLPISEIKEGTVLMRDGSLKAVIIVSAVNFALKSEQEKDAIIYSYQSFLNSLSFPIQILATSRKLDLSNYLKSIEKTAENQTNPLLKMQTEEYGAFIQELLDYSNIMEKRFYVVVPYYPGGLEALSGGILKKKQQQQMPPSSFEDNKKALLSRVEEIVNGLASVGLRCAALGTEDLLELYYTFYNPDLAQNVKIDSKNQDLGSPVITGGKKPEGAE